MENNEEEKIVEIPLARVKRIMKTDKDVKLVSSESILLVTRAAELLIENLSKESLKNSKNQKTIQYCDVCKIKF
jgi:histone H3/H4